MSTKLLSFLFGCCNLLTYLLVFFALWGVSTVHAQTLVVPGEGEGQTETFERSSVESEGRAEGDSKMVQLGDVKLSLPNNYQISLDRGDLFGYPYFAKLYGQTLPDFFVMEMVFAGEVEDVANSFFRNYLQPRFTLQDSRYIAGPPQRLLLVVKGAEMVYHLYFVNLNQRNAFLIFTVPVSPGSDHGSLAGQILSSVRLH